MQNMKPRQILKIAPESPKGHPAIQTISGKIRNYTTLRWPMEKWHRSRRLTGTKSTIATKNQQFMNGETYIMRWKNGQPGYVVCTIPYRSPKDLYNCFYEVWYSSRPMFFQWVESRFFKAPISHYVYHRIHYIQVADFSWFPLFVNALFDLLVLLFISILLLYHNPSYVNCL